MAEDKTEGEGGVEGRGVQKIWDCSEIASVAEELGAVRALWKREPPLVSTGFAQFDRLMSGGVRAGDMLVLGGPAKSGKSAFFGQVLYQLAKSGALGIYASVEMPRSEVIARWTVREAFLDQYRKADSGDWPLSFPEIVFGNTQRGENKSGQPIRDESTRERVQAR